MFDIRIVKKITKIIDGPFFLSPASTFELILYKDIETLEIIMDIDVDNFLNLLKDKHLLNYEIENNKYKVHLMDTDDIVYFIEMSKEALMEQLLKSPFNDQALAIEVNHQAEDSFMSLETSSNTFYSHWMDPFEQKNWLQRYYLQITNMNLVKNDGRLVYDLIGKMANYHMDLSRESTDLLMKEKNKINYPLVGSLGNLIDLFKDKRSYRYFKLLESCKGLNALDRLIPFEDRADFWNQSMQALDKLENILNTKNYFQEYICRNLVQRLSMTYKGGYSKLQLLKFSTLFYLVHKKINIESSGIQEIEKPFSSFCNFFSLDKQACIYYAHIVESNQKVDLDFKEALTKNDILSPQASYKLFKTFEEFTIDVLLIQYVHQSLGVNSLSEMIYKEKLENLMINYMTTYSDLKGINSELSTLEISNPWVSDDDILEWIDEVKEAVYLGKVDYNRKDIIAFIQNKAEALKKI